MNSDDFTLFFQFFWLAQSPCWKKKSIFVCLPNTVVTHDFIVVANLTPESAIICLLFCVRIMSQVSCALWTMILCLLMSMYHKVTWCLILTWLSKFTLVKFRIQFLKIYSRLFIQLAVLFSVALFCIVHIVVKLTSCHINWNFSGAS